MKKSIITIILVILFPIASHSQIFSFTNCCIYIDGYWGEWKSESFKSSGRVDNFVLYRNEGHPSNFFVRVKIDNYQTPTKADLKSHYKSGTWYRYQGTVEYYVTDEYPTIQSILKTPIPWDNWMFITPEFKSHTSCVKRTAKAAINFLPDEYYNLTINVFFDNVGFAISPSYRLL